MSAFLAVKSNLFHPTSLALVFLSLVGCTTPSTLGPLSVPLAYKTMAEPGDFATLPACAAISKIQVFDNRPDRTIGKRFIDNNAATAVPVTAASDVATWVRSGTVAALKLCGVPVGKTGAPILRIAVEQLRTNENVVHRSGYDGRIVLTARLISTSGGTCWSDRVSGAAENYGYSGTAENYQETLNHALDRAVISLTNLPGFRSAVCSCNGGN
jgi:hypothetical protein